jgi:hypothetical protein
MNAPPTSGESAADDAWARVEVDLAGSCLLIHTRATGLLARFAHNLEIEARGLELDARADGERWTAELRAQVTQLRVVGVLRAEQVHEDVLSQSDEEEIHRRIRDQVFEGLDVVRVHAEGSRRDQGEATIRCKRGQQRVGLRTRVEAGEAGTQVLSGRCTLSLAKLGVPEVKGPLGAFKVFDDVELLYSFVVRVPPGSG